MRRTKAQLRWRRIMSAADILLAALTGPEGANASIDVEIGTRFNPSRGTAGPFTVLEYVDAMTFLVKLGFVRSADGDRRAT